jgi:hypothetical protein
MWVLIVVEETPGMKHPVSWHLEEIGLVLKLLFLAPMYWFSN